EDAMPFVRFWQDYIHGKQGRPLREPENFKHFVDVFKRTEVKENMAILPPEVMQKQKCSTCEPKRERLMNMLKEIEVKARETRQKLEAQRTSTNTNISTPENTQQTQTQIENPSKES
ncbi:MAG: hypothetical protein QXI37_03190, partial [Thermoprotei archaeon]